MCGSGPSRRRTPQRLELLPQPLDLLLSPLSLLLRALPCLGLALPLLLGPLLGGLGTLLGRRRLRRPLGGGRQPTARRWIVEPQLGAALLQVQTQQGTREPAFDGRDR